MTRVLTGNNEIVKFEKGMLFEIIPHYYEDTFMGYNLMLENELIDTYDEEELAIAVMGELCKLIDDNVKFIDIEKINNLLEV